MGSVSFGLVSTPPALLGPLSQMVSNLVGIAVGVGATLMTALYQIWAGSKQKELKASSMQLLHAYTPQVRGISVGRGGADEAGAGRG